MENNDLMGNLKAYAEKFEEGFPMIPLGWGKSDEEVVKIIKRCLKLGKDVYELGLVKDDDEDIY